MTREETIGEPSEDWYQEVFETAPDAMVIIGNDAVIRFVNRQTERLFGYARSDLLGEPLDRLIPDRVRHAHADHVARFFASPSARPMGSGLELAGRRADGSEVALEVSLSPVQSRRGMLVSAAIRDISDRKRAEAAAKLAADRLVSAVESIQDAFALFDASDRLVLCNSAYRRLFSQSVGGPVIGRSSEELLELWMRDLAFATEEERARFLAQRIAGRQAPRSTFDVRTLDGRSLRVMDQRTLEGGMVKTVWDLTEDVRLAEELRQARTAAEAASAAKSEFLSSMSHELRTPLNAVLGFAHLLRRDRKDPLQARHQERVEQIVRGGEHLLRLIDDILDLARIEAGAVAISMEPVGVAEVLAELRTTLGPMAERAALTLEIEELRRDVPLISADRTRFLQILMNYGSNAIKYNRPGGKVRLTVSLPDDGHVRVGVTDTGTGIPAEMQDKLFQPFQRAGQETGPIEGTGIGLVITKRLAELMGGRVGFRSAAGEGSEFWVEMPVQEQSAVAPRAAAPTTNTPLELHTGGRRLVLYVEDNPANVHFMKDLLGTFENIELITAPTAEIGVELARTRHPAAIIMDINLPGMSGLDALRALRGIPETSSIPVIALTAAASERDRRRGEQAGFYAYLTKPVDIDELEAMLARALG